MILDGIKSEAYDALNWPVFSPDSKHIAYVVQKNGKKFMIKDGKKSPTFDSIGFPFFSPDSRHLAYMVKSEGRWSIAVDNKVGKKRFDGFLNRSALVFDDNTHFHGLAVQAAAPEFVKLEVEIKSVN